MNATDAMKAPPRWLAYGLLGLLGTLGTLACSSDGSLGSGPDASRPDASRLDASRPDASRPDGSPVGDAAVTDSSRGPVDGGAPPDAMIACDGPVTERYGTAEIVLHSSTTYSGTSGTNPFDVTLTATVTAPDGRSYRVGGFYDGNGSGGSDGDVFKLRVSIEQLGQYTWTTESSDASLGSQSGELCGQGRMPGVFAAGPLVVNPAHPRTFMYAEGDPVYLVGKFLDVAAPDPIKFSHTMFSEELNDGHRQSMLDRHVSMGLNKMNVYLANRGDYRGVSTTPWVGSADGNDKSRFDLARWHSYEAWTRKLRDAGLVAQLWFFADDSGFGDLSDADRMRLIRYGMARLSGYAHTMFILALEWQEGWSPTEVIAHTEFIQQQNPWDRLVSVHGVTGDFSYADAGWADYMDIQSGNSASHSTVHSMGLTNRAFADKPLINEEFGLGDEDTAHRQRAWAAFTAGGAGSGTGSFLLYLTSFANSVPFERMEPADDVVTSGSAYCLAEAGRHYVAYLYDGGSVTLDLGAASSALNVSWYDPRSGASTDAGTVPGGSPQSFSAPGGGDWVLEVRVP